MTDDLDPYAGDVGPLNDDDAYDDIPWADPQIKKDYEAALGRLILAHNHVDIHLTRLIRCVLEKMGDPEPLKALSKGKFAQRLEHLRMLSAITGDIRLVNLPYEEIATLNGQRNVVAHGHFEQNPFDGSYELITAKQTKERFPIPLLHSVAERLIKRGNELDVMIAFWDVRFDLPEGAEPVNPVDHRLMRSSTVSTIDERGSGND